MEVAHVIQLSVAPVFLLTGVGAFLNVLTGRLSRVIDRARLVSSQLSSKETTTDLHRVELQSLRKRMRYIDLSITLCTLCALLICIVICTLFVGSLWGADVSSLVVILFIAGMSSLIAALLSFLREIFVAISQVRLGLR